jgi:hypothetical protein
LTGKLTRLKGTLLAQGIEFQRHKDSSRGRGRKIVLRHVTSPDGPPSDSSA